MIAEPLYCPDCTSGQTVKNGRTPNGKQNYRCTNCGGQFVEDPQNKIIGQETKKLIDKLLLEKLPPSGIARVAEASKLWLKPSETCPNWLFDKEYSARTRSTTGGAHWSTTG